MSSRSFGGPVSVDHLRHPDPPLPPPPPPWPLNRSKYNIRRQVDGRVQLRSRGGKWFSVRLDLEVAGAMLLRDTDSGSVYAIETTDLPQVRSELPACTQCTVQQQEQELQQHEQLPASGSSSSPLPLLDPPRPCLCPSSHLAPAIPPPSHNTPTSRHQVDLSDDYVLMMMFSDGAWEEQMAPVEFVDDDSGLTQQLTMSDREFREFIGLLKDFEDDAGAK